VDQERNAMNAPGDTAPDEIRSDIERTREEMTETLGEIQDRLRPDHLLHQAKETVTNAASAKARQIMHSAGDTAQTVADQAQYAQRESMNYMRSHPTQMALLAGGLTWWLLQRDSRRPTYGRSRRAGQRVASESMPGAGATRVPTTGEYTAAGYEYTAAGQMPASGYSDPKWSGAKDVSERVRHVVDDASSRTRDQWYRTSASVDRWVHDNTLAAGAVAMAIGAAIGMSAPRTELEDRTMGETRDQALETASRKAQELKETVTQKVHDVTESVVGGGDGQSGPNPTGTGPGTPGGPVIGTA
jgi:ElaB/YqjD/DUF883 family membrane-anchored ribosome-binding protein